MIHDICLSTPCRNYFLFVFNIVSLATLSYMWSRANAFTNLDFNYMIVYHLTGSRGVGR